MFNVTTIGQGMGVPNTRLLAWGLGWYGEVEPVVSPQPPVGAGVGARPYHGQAIRILPQEISGVVLTESPLQVTEAKGKVRYLLSGTLQSLSLSQAMKAEGQVKHFITAMASTVQIEGNTFGRGAMVNRFEDECLIALSLLE